MPPVENESEVSAFKPPLLPRRSTFNTSNVNEEQPRLYPAPAGEPETPLLGLPVAPKPESRLRIQKSEYAKGDG